MPHTLQPPQVTPAYVIDRLAAGRPVTLEEPGWGDTGSGPCPDCGRTVQHFRARPDVRFEYGVTLAAPHRCGLPLQELQDHPHWLRLQRLQDQLHQLERSRIWSNEISYDGVTRK